MTALRRALPLLALLFVAGTSAAFDVGDPSFRTDETQSAWRFESVIDVSERRVRQRHDPILLGSPATGPVAYTFYDNPRQERTYNSSPAIVRLTHYPLDSVAMQFDLGIDSYKDSETFVVLGGATRILLTKSGPFQLAAQASARFAPEFETNNRGVSSTLGPYNASGKVSYSHYGAALLASAELPAKEGWRSVVYGGPRVSAFRSRAASFADYEGQFIHNGSPIGSRAWFSMVEKQTSVFGLVTGVRLDWGENWSARVEGRMIEEASLSVSLGANF